jgi:hypothetical protein
VKLGNGLGWILVRKKLKWNTTLPTTTIGVAGTPQMVFTNPIMTTHVNRIEDWPSTNSMVVERYRNVNVMNPKGGYRKPSIVIVLIFLSQKWPLC